MPAKTRQAKRDEALEMVRTCSLMLEKGIEEPSLKRLLFMQEYLGEAIELQKKIEKTEPVYETTNYIFTAPVDHEFEDGTLERIVEDFRAFAYPKVWGYEGKGPHTTAKIFRCEFEIEARESGTREYLDEVRNQMLTWFGQDYQIVEVTA